VNPNKLEQFGAGVLSLMQQHEEWDSRFTEAVQAEADFLGLAGSDGDGMFSAVWPIPFLGGYLAEVMGIALEALTDEYAAHHVTCALDITEERQRELIRRLRRELDDTKVDPKPMVYWTIVGHVPEQDNVTVSFSGPGMTEAQARRKFVEHLKLTGEFVGTEWEGAKCKDCQVCLDAVFSGSTPLTAHDL
jgi:hypothetical protein